VRLVQVTPLTSNKATVSMICVVLTMAVNLSEICLSFCGFWSLTPQPLADHCQVVNTVIDSAKIKINQLKTIVNIVFYVGVGMLGQFLGDLPINYTHHN